MSLTLHGTDGITFPDASELASGKQAVKAWLNFNGTGTVAIRDSYNVSSVTDNSTGNYSVNLTTALSNANYAINYNVNDTSGGPVVVAGQNNITANSTTSFRFASLNGATTATDCVMVSVTVFGGV